MKPDRYYFDGRVLHDENWQLPKGISRSDADMFPKWFLYRGEMIKDTVPCDLQPGMVEALREVYEETESCDAPRMQAGLTRTLRRP